MFYIVWKWSIGAPIIAGRRTRGAKELEPEQIEALIEKAYQNILGKLDKLSKVESTVTMKLKDLTTEEYETSNKHLTII